MAKDLKELGEIYSNQVDPKFYLHVITFLACISAALVLNFFVINLSTEKGETRLLLRIIIFIILAILMVLVMSRIYNSYSK